MAKMVLIIMMTLLVNGQQQHHHQAGQQLDNIVLFVDSTSSNNLSNCGSAPGNMACANIIQAVNSFLGSANNNQQHQQQQQQDYPTNTLLTLLMVPGVYPPDGNSDLPLFSINITMRNYAPEDGPVIINLEQIVNFISVYEPTAYQGDGISLIELDGLTLTNGSNINGGAISIITYLMRVNLTINNCVMSDHVASGRGGVLYFEPQGQYVNYSVVLNNTSFYNNMANSMIFTMNDGHFRMTNCSVANNVAMVGDIISLYIQQQPAYIHHTRFTNNSINSLDQGYKSAIVNLTRTSAQIDHCTFSNNANGSQVAASNNQAHLDTKVYLEVGDCTFSSNTGGGGLINGLGLNVDMLGWVSINNSLFHNNSGGGLGVNLYAVDTIFIGIDHSRFIDSPSIVAGQSIYMYFDGNMSVTNSHFSNNGVADIYCYSSDVMAINNTFDKDTLLVVCEPGSCQLSGHDFDTVECSLGPTHDSSSEDAPHRNPKTVRGGIIFLSIILFIISALAIAYFIHFKWRRGGGRVSDRDGYTRIIG
ncbi:hypothetical protein SAMD00019534_047380 [Acytostelium subglobosum LB1]|uniref:hypothetical protein n=1 Tax=Acytostelium subglobosum LB1 TaxID=1410327 RepID=UPI00064521DC|nr:hypothetical protein SAMD00019534_047380 [Acytostelium subglobosum LB1]GAM21563.1 hypothetical protein SAMD00019534_047380 [Acytostelium subglobosum LB1]|eukprot:XP_012755682.1 hypothetical protein SAMD00019534_047380 [Acytostelium subglobosum LB1]